MSTTLPHLLAGVPELQTSAPSASSTPESKGPRKSVVNNIVKSLAARRRAGLNDLPTSRFAEAQQQRLQKAKRAHRPLPGQRPAKRAYAAAGTVNAVFRLAKSQAEAPAVDVEMKDAAKEEPCEAKVSIAIPARLARPKYKRVPIEKALFMNEALRDIPIEYIQDELAQNGQNLLGVLEHVEVPPPLPVSIPQQIDVEVTDASADLPTHMLAVYRKDLPEGERAVVTMLAAHQCVWDLNCAHLPSLPPSPASASATAPGAPEAPVHLTIPVVPLGLPNPEHFRELLCYMYTKRADELLAELLPAPPPSAAQGQDAMDRYARSLARAYERTELLKRMARVQGVWRNACALGVFDDGLWAMIDLAWDVYGKAVATDVPGKPTPVWDSSLKTLSFR